MRSEILAPTSLVIRFCLQFTYEWSESSENLVHFKSMHASFIKDIIIRKPVSKFGHR